MTSTRLDSQAMRMMHGAAAVVSGRSPLSALVCGCAGTVADDATLPEAAAKMEAAGVSALLLERAGGIVTDRDIIRALAYGAPLDQEVATVATQQPLTVPGTMTVVDACAVMLNEGVRHLVVELDGGVGVTSLAEVAAVLLQAADPQIWLTALRVAIDVPTEIWLG
jgi:CBS domain-containing protein